ncbi:MAG: peptide deformylase [Alphaproteobacteria bacterium]|nr:MAG: peptide deformylase [Alphaproteobacteria bacterium]
MTLRTILIHPDPRLKTRCRPVERFDAALRKLAEDMLETMYDAPGIGLAAPQVGVTRRLLVMDASGKEEPPQPMVLVNPEVTWASEDLNTHEEGCLSIPDIYEEVTRPARVRVRWQDLDGKAQEQEFDGLWATCVQHEIDHLDGRLFIDYLGAVKRSMITAKMKKLKKQRA